MLQVAPHLIYAYSEFWSMTISGIILTNFKRWLYYKQGHREFPFWKRKIPPAKEKIPENSRSVKCLILHALTQ